MTMQGLDSIWPSTRPLIGMIHLSALPGAPAWGGSMDAVIDRAVADAAALAAAGFDGLMVENYRDVPFFRGDVPPETVAGLTACVRAVLDGVKLPVGVNVLRNDARAALGIAAATGARFVRVNVHTGSMWTDQGLIEGQAADTLRARAALGIDVAILADVHVKHATPPSGSSIGDAAADAWHRGLADALVVTGPGTGRAARSDELTEVREAVHEATILLGSGVSHNTVRALLHRVDGAIVGSAVMTDGVAGSGVDRGRAAAFIEAARSG